MYEKLIIQNFSTILKLCEETVDWSEMNQIFYDKNGLKIIKIFGYANQMKTETNAVNKEKDKFIDQNHCYRNKLID
jgi:hypothetical protein